MIEILEKKLDQLDVIKELWEMSRDYHQEKSTYFEKDFESLTFEKRMAMYQKEDRLRIFLAVDTKAHIKVGYILLTLDEENKGEVASLYLREDYRKQGIGHELMVKGLAWLESKNPVALTVGVAYGNEAVYNFYKGYGFYPKVMLFKRRGL